MENIGQYFHLYGFILGLSLVLGIWLVQLKAHHLKMEFTELESNLGWIIGGGILGARFWHVLTDWQLYQANPWAALAIWQGGLSIIGAVIGGVLVTGLLSQKVFKKLTFGQALDLAAFGLPFSQALGRLGNYVNQEVYGLPSQLPWAIHIDELYRLPQYQHVDTYHPLFAYEMVGTLAFGLWIWWYSSRPKSETNQWLGKIGTGRWLLLYIWYYSLIRIGLDFLRLEKTVVPGTTLGINQLVLLMIMVVVSSIMVYYRRRLEKPHDD